MFASAWDVGLLVVLSPLILVVFALLVQVLFAYSWLVFIRLRYRLHHVPEPKIAKRWNRYFSGHNQAHLLFGLTHSQSTAQFLEWGRQYGSVYLTRGVLGAPILMVQSATAINQISSRQTLEKFCKPPVMINQLASTIGRDSVILAHGEIHKRIRRIATPAFHYLSLLAIASTFFRHARNFADHLLKHQPQSMSRPAEKGNILAPDVPQVTHQHTFSVIIDACFGDSVVPPRVVDLLRERYFMIMHEPAKFAKRRWFLQRLFTFLPSHWFGYAEGEKRKIKEFLHSLFHIVPNMYTIEQREGESSGTTPGSSGGLKKVASLFSLIVDAEEQQKITDAEKISMVLTFLLAGHVTTTYGIIWLLYNLAANEEWQTRVRNELREHWRSDVAEDGTAPDEALRSLDQLPILERVVKESLRKNPPSAYTLLETAQVVEIDGFEIPPGVLVRMPLHAHLHDPDVWGRDADEFQPDRWLDPLLETVPTFYTVFWHGNRGCIGKRFAVLELKAFVAILLLRARVHVDAKDGEPTSRGIMSVPEGMRLYLTPFGR